MNPVVVSLGDPDGVGPEVLKKAMADPRLPRGGPVVVYGSEAALERAPGPPLPGFVEVVDLPDDTGALALEAAVTELVEGRAAALVTGPIEKARVAGLLGDGFVGQTEYLAERYGMPGREVMMLGGPRLKVALLTTHLPLRRVPDAITVEGTIRVLRTVARDLGRWFGIQAPRLAIAALNPHAGERGRMGREEQEILEPAVARARDLGLSVDGPLPADSLFARAARGRWDAVVACYHDQGLGPLKALAFDEAINVTLGLPGLRVSPDHGVARDIAGKGVANHGSMLMALELAMGAQTPRGV